MSLTIVRRPSWKHNAKTSLFPDVSFIPSNVIHGKALVESLTVRTVQGTICILMGYDVRRKAARVNPVSSRNLSSPMPAFGSFPHDGRTAREARRSLGPRPRPEDEQTRTGRDNPRHAETFVPYCLENGNEYLERVLTHATLTPGFSASWTAESSEWSRCGRVDRLAHLWWFLSGEIEASFGSVSSPERVFRLRPGDVLIVPERRRYSVRNIGPHTSRHVDMYFLLRIGGTIDAIDLLDLGGAYPLSDSPLFNDSIAEECARVYARRPFYWHKTLESELWRIILYIVRNHPPHDLDMRPNFTADLLDRVLPAMHVVQDRLGDPNLRIDDLCKAVNLHRTRLWQVFRDNLGISPKQYIQHARMERACVLLDSTNETVEAIAEAVGYHNSIEHFYRLFRACMGRTPNEYRNGYTDRGDAMPIGQHHGMPWFERYGCNKFELV